MVVNSNIKENVTGVLKYIPGMLVKPVIGLLSLTVFTRIFSTTEYGLLMLITTTVTFINTVLFSCVNQSAIRYLPKYEGKERDQLISTSLISIIALALFVLFLVFTVSKLFCCYFNETLLDLLYWIPFLICTEAGFNFLMAVIRAERRAARYSTNYILVSIGKLAISLMLIYFTDITIKYVFLGSIIANGAIFILELNKLKYNYKLNIKYFSVKVLKLIWSYGLPIVGIATANQIISVSDRYFIEIFMDASHVGIYSASYSLSEMSIFMFINILMMANYPDLVYAFENSGEKATITLMRDMMSIYLLVLLPILFCIIVLSKDVIGIILGNSFLEANKILPWVSGGMFLMGLTNYFNKCFALKEKTKKLLFILVLIATINILLNIVLIPIVGITGAAVSTFISYLTGLIVTIILSRKSIKWEFPWRSFFKASFATVVMVIALLIFYNNEKEIFNIIISLSLSLTIYVCVIIVLYGKIYNTIKTILIDKIK